MENLIEKLINGFSRKNPRKVYCFDEKVSPEFMECIRTIHNGVLPNDFIFETVFRSLIQIQESLEYKEFDRLFEDRGEYVDSLTSVYNHDQREHYNQFSEYAEAAKVDNLPEDSTIQDCMAMGMYLHCDEIFGEVLEYIKERQS